ncbi:MAG: RHS repeat-associated core domain-containing protein [Polyangiaceae bacterium]|nr:RHS repeat-associated core domain-containing protein [Polyangiaceae bacterium]
MPHLASITYGPFDQMANADLGGGGDAYYQYDASGQRVRKLIDTGANLIKERIYLGAYELYREHISGDIDLERQSLHVMDGTRRVALLETLTIEDGDPVTTPTTHPRFQLGNHLDSALLEVDETGLIISYEEYAPYGTSAYRSAKSGVEVSARRYRYTGKERDDETGLYYYGARYYAAWLGRWTSADPLGIGADGPGVYNYVRGSPVVYSDPSGMESWSEETVQRHADRRPPPRPAQEPKAEPEVPDDLTTGQTIDPRIDVGVPDAVPPELAFANEIRANIGALLAAERAAALTGEGGASAGLAELEARDPFAGASGNSAQPNEIGPMTDAELGFWQTLGGAYLGVRIPAGPAHAVGALTLASAESHDDPSFVLGTMAVLPGMPAVSQALDRATGAAADLAYQSAFVFTGVGGTGSSGRYGRIRNPNWRPRET